MLHSPDFIIESKSPQGSPLVTDCQIMTFYLQPNVRSSPFRAS